MSRPNLKVRLVNGTMLPVPLNESRDGTIILTPETEMIVRDSSWARRRIARGDLEVVREEPFTMATGGPEQVTEPVTIEIDFDSLVDTEE